MTPPREEEPPPPLLGSWRALYALVIGALAVQVIAFWLVTRAYT